MISAQKLLSSKKDDTFIQKVNIVCFPSIKRNAMPILEHTSHAFLQSHAISIIRRPHNYQHQQERKGDS